MTTKMINERPSKLTNLGQEVTGAKRHHFDTYDNPEKRAEKAKAKATKDNRKAIKETAMSSLVDGCDFREILCRYEMALTLEKIPAYGGNRDGSGDALRELKAHVIGSRGQESYNLYVDAFNRLSRKLSRIRWNVRSLEDAIKYLAPKEKKQFKEFNGVQRPWALDSASQFNETCIDALASSTRAIQFGNSLTLQERQYCLQNLHDSITLLGQFYQFNFKALAFSFGARGVAGSIAHYQDSQKVLAFNRGWSGAFIHELGHAVDYSLGKVSHTSMPWSIRSKYREKLRAAGVTGASYKYYAKEVEIFARLFEVYLREEIPGMSEFMQVTWDKKVMPDLDDESRKWMAGVLESLKAGAQ